MGTAKGGAMQAPPSYMPNIDNSAQFESTLNSYRMQSEQALQQNQLMFQNELANLQSSNEEFQSNLPSIIGSDAADIDWAAKSDELKKKMAADFVTQQALKKSRMSTIITSPLLDEEEPMTSASILSGA